MATMCEECLHIGRGERSLEDLDWYAHHTSIISFLSAVKQGCYVCAIIFKEMERVDGGSTRVYVKTEPFLKYYLNIKSDNAELRKITDLYFFPANEDPGHFVRAPPFPICFILEEATDIDLELCSEEIGYNTSSESAYQLASSWLSNCYLNHPLCKLGHQSRAWWPSRLVDIYGGVDGDNPALVLRANMPISGHYITLSHCWGKGVVYCLTSSTFEALQKSIPIQSLSKTFQQAINITKTLGERYLWIDSLCILQDSLEDWTKESAMMGQIYLQAHCNISATAANDGSEGCFFPRNRRTIGPAIFYCHTKGFESLKPHRIWHSGQWDSDVEQARLGTRAWVIQEKLLSPRKLLYTSSQLYWQCRELMANEAFPKGFVGSSKGSESLSKLLAERLKVGTTDSTNLTDDKELYDSTDMLWYLVIRAYSSTELTYQSDKLVAIGGLARILQDSQKDEYVWGFWRQRFLTQLFWSVHHGRRGNGQTSYRPVPYRAPAWSWTSVEGIITTTGADYGELMSDHIHLIKIPEAMNPSGPATRDLGDSSILQIALSNAVTVEAGTCRARILNRSHHVSDLRAHDLLLMEHAFDDSSLPRDLVTTEYSSSSLTVYVDKMGNRAYVDTYSFKPDESRVQQYQDEYLCVVGAASCSDSAKHFTKDGGSLSWMERHTILRALLLAKVTLNDLGNEHDVVYRRVGLYLLEVSSGDPDSGLALERKIITMI